MVQLTFEHAVNLWFLLLLPAFVVGHFFFLRHAKKRALLFANFRALKRVTGQNLITKNYLLLALQLLILLSIVLAISGTSIWYEGESSNDDFVLAIDTSSSMTAIDVQPSRIEAAKHDAALFVDSLDMDARIGVISFAGVALIQTVPIGDKVEVKAFLTDLEPIEAGGTDIPGAIITSTNLLLDNSKGRAIIMITDGSSTIETFIDSSMQRAIEYAKEHHVRIHTIGVGTNMGPVGYLPEYYNVSSVYNEENLLSIANATGGVYSKAETNEQLLDAFQEIANSGESQLLRRNLTATLMFAALIMLLVQWLLLNTRFRIFP